MKRSNLSAIALAVGMLTMTGLARAGDIVGYVMNPYNRPAAGAQVRAILNGSVVRVAYTSYNGSYTMRNLPASKYYYTVDAKLNSWYGITPNSGLFMPGYFYWYPAHINVQLR